jgi:putative endonuclease
VAGTSPAMTDQNDSDLVGPSTAAVYILASRKHGTLYIGVTSDLIGRVVEHREGLTPGFTSTYGVKRLVWFERHESIVPAIQREKSLKKYHREWKINLIERDNPHWDDLFPALLREPGPLERLSWREPPAPERPPRSRN